MRVTIKRGDIYPHLYVDPPRWVEGGGGHVCVGVYNLL